MGKEIQNLDQLTREDLPEILEAAEHYRKRHDYRQALGHYMLAMHAAPDDLGVKEKFVDLAFSFGTVQHNPFMEKAVLDCFRTENLDCQPLETVWLPLLCYNPKFSGFFPERVFDQDAFKASADDSVFTDPFLTEGLKNFNVIASPEFELFLKALRQRLLSGSMQHNVRLEVGAAVAAYCFHSEYLLDSSAEEDEALSGLKRKIERGEGHASDIAVYCCYREFNSLSNAEDLAKSFESDAFLKAVIDEQFTHWRRLQEIKGTIKALTPIEDSVSRDVRGQYEQFPYPRWRVAPRVELLPRVKKELNEEGLRILVAGCGTGHEPAMYAGAFPEAKITAVDLSLSSLAYGKMRTGELGYTNIDFWQGDILKLDTLEEEFDIVSCNGVLHHMKDPLAGWRILKERVRDGGFMRISLYSKIARANILKAQAFIREKRYAFDAEGIRTFRREAPQVLEKGILRTLHNTYDYYSMSMCRDLLFHVQEHDFDIPQIEAALDDLGLEFIGFSNVEPIMGDYKRSFPGDPSGKSLVKWNVFERKHPDLFKAMYQFWCRKPA